MKLEHCVALPRRNMPSSSDLFLKIELQKVRGDFRIIGRLRGLFGKFGIDGVPVNYLKVQGVFHKIDGLQNHFNKVHGFFYKIHGVRHDY